MKPKKIMWKFSFYVNFVFFHVNSVILLCAKCFLMWILTFFMWILFFFCEKCPYLCELCHFYVNILDNLEGWLMGGLLYCTWTDLVANFHTYNWYRRHKHKNITCKTKIQIDSTYSEFYSNLVEWSVGNSAASADKSKILLISMCPNRIKRSGAIIALL